MEAYPEFEDIYREVFQFRYQVKELILMYSEGLKILDSNTVQYMVEEQQKEIEELKEDREKLRKEAQMKLAEKDNELAEKDNELAEKDSAIKTAVNNLYKNGSAIEQIAATFGKTVDEIEVMISK